MIRYRADWVLPIADAPIRGGWVALERDRIADVGSGATDAINLGRAVILPALVNAHTHLELSYLRDVVPPSTRFTNWVRVLMAARRQYPDPSDPRIIRAALAGIDEARATGTGLVGDVSNTLVTVPLLRDAGLAAHVFYELLGFNTPNPQQRVDDARAQVRETVRADDSVRVSLAPHAPYSVSPALFSAIRTDLDNETAGLSTVHLGESSEELEFLEDGEGPWRTLLEELGVWTDEWTPPGGSPVEYLADLGFLDSRVIVVHGVQFSGDDLATLRSLGVTIVSCPRSNKYVGVGDPPIESFYAMGVSVAFGTDSLASVQDLNMFSELAHARRLAPRVSARTLLESATLCGAAALGFERDFGTIEAGKRASLIAVQVPNGVTDVEEYLLSGIEPGAIRWLDHE